MTIKEEITKYVLPVLKDKRRRREYLLPLLVPPLGGAASLFILWWITLKEDLTNPWVIAGGAIFLFLLLFLRGVGWVALIEAERERR